MTDRERYLILLSATVKARHLLGGIATPTAALAARRELHKGVEMVKDETSQTRFLEDCAASEEAVKAYGG